MCERASLLAIYVKQPTLLQFAILKKKLQQFAAPLLGYTLLLFPLIHIRIYIERSPKSTLDVVALLSRHHPSPMCHDCCSGPLIFNPTVLVSRMEKMERLDPPLFQTLFSCKETLRCTIDENWRSDFADAEEYPSSPISFRKDAFVFLLVSLYSVISTMRYIC